MARAPHTARRYRDRSLETVPLDEVVAGDLLLVAAGDVVPVDGALAADAAVLDESGCTRYRKTRRTCRSTTTRKP